MREFAELFKNQKYENLKCKSYCDLELHCVFEILYLPLHLEIGPKKGG